MSWRYIYLKGNGKVVVRKSNTGVEGAIRRVYVPESIWRSSQEDMKYYLDKVVSVEKVLNKLAGKG